MGVTPDESKLASSPRQRSPTKSLLPKPPSLAKILHPVDKTENGLFLCSRSWREAQPGRKNAEILGSRALCSMSLQHPRPDLNKFVSNSKAVLFSQLYQVVPGAFLPPLHQETSQQKQAERDQCYPEKEPQSSTNMSPGFDKCHFLKEALSVDQELTLSPLTHCTSPWKHSSHGRAFFLSRLNLIAAGAASAHSILIASSSFH